MKIRKCEQNHPEDIGCLGFVCGWYQLKCLYWFLVKPCQTYPLAEQVWKGTFIHLLYIPSHPILAGHVSVFAHVYLWSVLVILPCLLIKQQFLWWLKHVESSIFEEFQVNTLGQRTPWGKKQHRFRYNHIDEKIWHKRTKASRVKGIRKEQGTQYQHICLPVKYLLRSISTPAIY